MSEEKRTELYEGHQAYLAEKAERDAEKERRREAEKAERAAKRKKDDASDSDVERHKVSRRFTLPRLQIRTWGSLSVIFGFALLKINNNIRTIFIKSRKNRVSRPSWCCRIGAQAAQEVEAPRWQLGAQGEEAQEPQAVRASRFIPFPSRVLSHSSDSLCRSWSWVHVSCGTATLHLGSGWGCQLRSRVMSVVSCLPTAFLVFQFDDLLPLLMSTCPFMRAGTHPTRRRASLTSMTSTTPAERCCADVFEPTQSVFGSTGALLDMPQPVGKSYAVCWGPAHHQSRNLMLVNMCRVVTNGMSDLQDPESAEGEASEEGEL